LPLRFEVPWPLGIWRLPTRSPALPVDRLAPVALVLGAALARFAPAVPARFAAPAGCVRAPALEFCRAVACRVASESPRADPP
jgi:hypothetical protein